MARWNLGHAFCRNQAASENVSLYILVGTIIAAYYAVVPTILNCDLMDLVKQGIRYSRVLNSRAVILSLFELNVRYIQFKQVQQAVKTENTLLILHSCLAYCRCSMLYFLYRRKVQTADIIMSAAVYLLIINCFCHL